MGYMLQMTFVEPWGFDRTQFKYHTGAARLEGLPGCSPP